ncbi:MAG: DUF2073 domain-containing protein [archaeon]
MLTLQFIPYYEIEKLSSAKRIKKLMDIVKTNKIVLLEGRLKKEEEKDLIEITMEEIDDKFKGIELTVVYPEQKDDQIMAKLKRGFASMILGDRIGFTIIGPASVVKEIRRDPDKIQLYVTEGRKSQTTKKTKKRARRK